MKTKAQHLYFFIGFMLGALLVGGIMLSYYRSTKTEIKEWTSAYNRLWDYWNLELPAYRHGHHGR